MDDKTTGVGGERLSGRSDEYGSGPAATPDYSTSRLGGRAAGSGDTTRGYTGSSTTEPPEQRTREIRKEIERTREDMSETVNAIQDRLRPGNIAASAAESVKTAATETARNVAESDSVQYVRANPIPTAMVGIGVAGLAWLAFGGREARSRRWTERGSSRDWSTVRAYDDADRYYRGSGSSARGYQTAGAYTAGVSADSDRDFSGAASIAERTSEMADEVRWRAQQTTRRAQRQLQNAWQESPLLVGAASAVLGAIIGMALPQTEKENELMGEARDTAVEGVQQTVRETVERVQDAATSAVGLISDDADKKSEK